MVQILRSDFSGAQEKERKSSQDLEVVTLQSKSVSFPQDGAPILLVGSALVKGLVARIIGIVPNLLQANNVRIALDKMISR